MLEAFKASTSAEKAPHPTPSAGGAAPGGPFAAPPLIPPPAPAPKAAAASGERLAWKPTLVQRLIVLQVLLLLTAFWLGRATAPSVQAADDTETTPTPNDTTASANPIPQVPPTKPPEVAPANSALKAAVDALQDPKNVYTVVVVDYSSMRDEALASATRDYLLNLGLPAAAVRFKSRLKVVVGAAPQQSELTALRDRLQELNGPPPLNKKREFHDAFISRIDRAFKNP